MENKFNLKDRDQWNQIFEKPNPAWKQAPEQAYMKDACDLFKSVEANAVLDLGCGVGIWSIYLARNGFKVFGTDFSSNAVQICRDWAAEEGLGAQFETAAITADAFPEQNFDAIVAAMILENVSRDEMKYAIALMKSKLNPRGVVFALFNPLLSQEQLEAILKAGNPTKGITSERYSDDEIQAAFKDFEILNFKKYPLQGMEFRGLALRKK